MSFYIRKSIKFGPIRLNFSKSGVGVSAGVKGARVATGPRGTYIHLGGGGIYYRQKLDGSVASQDTYTNPKNANESYSKSFDNESINFDNLIETTNKDTLSQINSRIQQPAIAWVLGLLSTIFVGMLALVTFGLLDNASALLNISFSLLAVLSSIVIIGVWFLGIWVTWVTSQQEKLARTTTLRYSLDEKAKSKFTNIQKAFELIAKSAFVWRVTSRVPTWDWKRNAGATSLLQRRRITVGYMQPPYIHTKFKVYGLWFDTFQMFFFPDQILVYQNKRYGAIDYASLRVDFSPTRFIEDEVVPKDSRIVDYTWRYVRKDGGPDGRFSNNRQIPVVQYGYIEMVNGAGINLHFQVSNLSHAKQFTEDLLEYVGYTVRPSTNKSSTSSKHQNQSANESNKSDTRQEENAYTVLNVPSTASWDEISSAYRKLAQMYHPDKVTGLAPEYREIAEKRMKIINNAYEQLKRTFGR